MIRYIVIVALIGWCSGCDDDRSAAPPTVASPTVNKERRATPPTPDQEAVALAWDHFNRSWTKCSDSYVSLVRGGEKGGNVLEQKKGVQIYILRDDPLTEADRLNGIKFRKTFCFGFTARREYRFDQIDPMGFHRSGLKTGWTSWTPPNPMGPDGFWWLTISRTEAGDWSVEPAGYGTNAFADSDRRVAISCNQVPAEDGTLGEPIEGVGARKKPADR